MYASAESLIARIAASSPAVNSARFAWQLTTVAAATNAAKCHRRRIDTPRGGIVDNALFGDGPLDADAESRPNPGVPPLGDGTARCASPCSANCPLPANAGGA